MIKEVTTARPKKALALNNHHTEIGLTFAWKQLEKKPAPANNRNVG